MNNPKREQVRQLTPEAQEAVGSFLLEKARQREQLMKKAKLHFGWFGWGWECMYLQVAFTISGFLIATDVWQRGSTSGAAMLALWGLVLVVDIANIFRARRIERRMDALIELLEKKGAINKPPHNSQSAIPKTNGESVQS